jgi:SAM-dependent methyltransferase
VLDAAYIKDIHMSDVNGFASSTLEHPIGRYLVPGRKLSAEALSDYYNDSAIEAKGNYDANDWADPEQMYAQFDFVIKHIDLNGKSLLDVGSGNGLFFEYLASKNIVPSKITAIDIAEEQIKVVRDTYPNVTAIADDFFKYEFEESYDVITMFGVAPCLKFIFPDRDRLSSLLRLLDRSIRYAKEAVAFSFLNKNCYERSEEEHYEYLYYYPEEICTMLSGARYDISTALNDLVSNALVYCHETSGEPFRFNLNRIDDAFKLLR